MTARRHWFWRWTRRVALAALGVALVPYACLLWFGARDCGDHADCIVVPGAAVWRNRRPSEALQYRLDRAAALWREGRARWIVVTGGGEGDYDEAAVMTEYLVELGVSPQSIVQERASATTRENAEHTAEILRRRGWKSALVCTQWFHVPRTRLALEQAGVTTFAAPCGGNRLTREPYFVAREMVGLPAYCLRLDEWR